VGFFSGSGSMVLSLGVGSSGSSAVFVVRDVVSLSSDVDRLAVLRNAMLSDVPEDDD
jgi:hypothetical protein